MARQQQQQHGQPLPQPRPEQHLGKQHHDRQRNRASYPPPLLVAELDAVTPMLGSVTSPEGAVAFEMPAEPAAPRSDEEAQDKRPRTEEVGPETQANPWPFYLDQDLGQAAKDESSHSANTTATTDGAQAANPWPYHGPQMDDDDDFKPSATVYPQVTRPTSAAGTAPTAPGATANDVRTSDQLSPTSPGDQGAYPLPLRISRPNSMVASSPPPIKPYSPPPGRDDLSPGGMSYARPAQSPVYDANSPSTAPLHYKPYRPPGSPRPDHASPTATSPGAAPHHFYMPTTEDRHDSPAQRQENRVPSPAATSSPLPNVATGSTTDGIQRPPYPTSPEQRKTSPRPVSQNGPSNSQHHPPGEVSLANLPPGHNTVTSPHSAVSATSLPPRVQSSGESIHSSNGPSKSPVSSTQAYSRPQSQSPSVASSPPSIQQHIYSQSPMHSPPSHGYQSPSVQSAHSDPNSPPAHPPPPPPPPPAPQSPPTHQIPASPPPMYSPGPGGPPRPNSLSPQPTSDHYQHPHYPPPPAQPPYGSYTQGPPPRPAAGPPPPLPPRRPQIPYGGFGGGPSNPASYPPPPKTHYKPGPGPPAYPPRPVSNAVASSSLFSSSSAKKWLDKTSQVIENTLESVLQGPQGPPNRPAYIPAPPPQQQPPPWNGGGYQQPGMPPHGGYNGPRPGTGSGGPRRS